MQARGLTVTVVDDQPGPGGRIFAAIETRAAHGPEDQKGKSLAARFRHEGGVYLPQTEVWQIEGGPKVFFTRDGRASVVEPQFVIMATGAQERPMPFPGWQLPGVMTVGGAQILLKTAGQIPDKPVWLAGSGPLLLLYAHQLIATGGTLAGILDTKTAGGMFASLPHLPGALRYGWRDLMRGLAWLQEIQSVEIVRDVTSLEAVGDERLRSVRYRTEKGDTGEVSTQVLLVHDGVVPSLHGTLSAGCEHRWNVAQRCFEPIVDAFGASTVAGIYVAGDGATIGGARAAILSGRLTAIGVASAAGKVSLKAAEKAAAPLRRELVAAARFRRFIDKMYPPVELPIPDATIVCRCEEVTAGQTRAALYGRAHMGPDGIKIATRAGMGPCQGRQCGSSLTRLVAEAHGKSPEEVGFLRIRPPLKPLRLNELAALDCSS